jgi:hypothetical protein
MKTSSLAMPAILRLASINFPLPPVKGICVFMHGQQRLCPTITTGDRTEPKPGAASVSLGLFIPLQRVHALICASSTALRCCRVAMAVGIRHSGVDDTAGARVPWTISLPTETRTGAARARSA